MKLLFSLICVYFIHAKQPNVILFIGDDIGVSDLSFSANLFDGQNEPTIPTPNLDEVASKGQILSKFHTHRLGSTTRSSLFTSVFGHNLGNPHVTRHDHGSLMPNWRTFVHELQERKFNTAYIGKWGIDLAGMYCNKTVGMFETTNLIDNNSEEKESGFGPRARGFDYFEGGLAPGHHHLNRTATACVDWHVQDHNGMISFPYIEFNNSEYSSRAITKTSLSILDTFQDESLFLTIAYPLGHSPLVDIEEFEWDPPCINFTSSIRRQYCAMIQMLDGEFKKIIDYLEKENQLEDSIIIFLSDNGATPLFGGLNYPLRGGKDTPYEGGINTPAFIYAPSFGLESGVYDDYFHAVDMGPTILNMVDEISNSNYEDKKNLFEQIDGLDLSSNLKNKNSLNPSRTSFIADVNVFQKSITYIEGDMKMIVNPGLEEFVYPESDKFYRGIHSNCSTWRTFIPQTLIWIGNFHKSIDMWHVQYAIFSFFQYYWMEWFGIIEVKWMKYKIEGEDITNRGRYSFQPINITSSEIFLFNLKDDPSESVNLAKEKQDFVQNLVDKINEEMISELPPQSAAIPSMLGTVFEEFKKIMISLSIIGSFLFGGFLLTIACLIYLTFIDPMTPEEYAAMEERMKTRQAKKAAEKAALLHNNKVD